MISVEKTAKIFSRINASQHNLTVYFEDFAFFSTEVRYRTYFHHDGSDWIADFSIPPGLPALSTLKSMVENHLGVSGILLLPVEGAFQ